MPPPLRDLSAFRRVIYNEIEPFPAQWMRNLVVGGHIARGLVDTRSVADIRPEDLQDVVQFHTFAGIGVWSYALRLAGWPDDRPVWTGSCPCQPFSQAGAGGAFDDPRHLWPAWFRLIEQCRPPVIFGEQVASPAGRAWLDLVYADLEGAGYSVGAAVLPAAGVGAPHGRHRILFVADAHSERQREHGEYARTDGDTPPRRDAHGRGEARPPTREPCEWVECRDGKRRPVEPIIQSLAYGASCGMGHVRADISTRAQQEIEAHAANHQREPREALHDLWCTLGADAQRSGTPAGLSGIPEATVLFAFLRQLQVQGWPLAQGLPREGTQAYAASLRELRHNDAAARPSHRRGLDEQQTGESADTVRFLSSVLARHAQEAWPHAFPAYAPAAFPLAHGAPARVGRLRGYGNAIVAEVAATFIRAFMDVADVVDTESAPE